MLSARDAEFKDLLDRAVRWAVPRGDVLALALVGSWARGEPGPGSDVDFVVLTNEPGPYLEREDWIGELGADRVGMTRSWGPLTKRRLALPSGLEVEMGFAPPSWAAVDPVDPGTRQVVAAGMRILHDPMGLLTTLATTVQESGKAPST